jgi:hypothetical protein
MRTLIALTVVILLVLLVLYTMNFKIAVLFLTGVIAYKLSQTNELIVNEQQEIIGGKKNTKEMDKNELMHGSIPEIKKILCISAYDHELIPGDFPMVKEFVFVNSYPLNFYERDHFTKGTYSDNFVDELIKKMSKKGFHPDANTKTILSKHERKRYLHSTKFTFLDKNKKRTIHYFLSTPVNKNFAEHNYEELKKHMKECDTIVIAGKYPHKSIYDYIPNIKNIFGYTGTYYFTFDKSDIDNYSDDDLHEMNSFIYMLAKDKKVDSKYSYYAIIDAETRKKINPKYLMLKCKNYADLRETVKKIWKKANP